jgi:hypothetical protein
MISRLKWVSLVPMILFAQQIEIYVDKIVIPRSFEPFPEISFSNLKIEGEFAGYSGLAFWKSVCSKTDPMQII